MLPVYYAPAYGSSRVGTLCLVLVLVNIFIKYLSWSFYCNLV